MLTSATAIEQTDLGRCPWLRCQKACGQTLMRTALSIAWLIVKLARSRPDQALRRSGNVGNVSRVHCRNIVGVAPRYGLRSIVQTWVRIAVGFFCVAINPVVCFGDEIEFILKDQPKSSYFDRWMYPFNVTPGSRIQAPTFGALGSEGFDERDGQFVIGLNTADLGIVAGLPPQQYQVNSATLTLTETFGGYQYDPTYDAFQTYLDPESANFQADEDDGRPIELYGVGFRSDFTEFAWPDGFAAEVPAYGSANSFGGEGGVGKSVRGVFAADATGNDVSNNVDSLADGANGFNPTPFAIARLVADNVELEPGEVVTARTKWVFDIEVENESIHSYFANALATGQLGLAVTSMHTTGVQGSGDPFPNPATANHFAFDGPVLTLDVDVVAGILGDFNGDTDLTAADIDLLSAAVREASSNAAFDLNGDGMVTAADRETWVTLTGTLPGDADFSGDVAFPDFLKLSQNFGQAGGWADGDFDGSGEIAFPDFLTLSQNFGQSTAAIASVPEPNGSHSLICVLATTLVRKRRRSGSCQRSFGLGPWLKTGFGAGRFSKQLEWYRQKPLSLQTFSSPSFRVC